MCTYWSMCPITNAVSMFVTKVLQPSWSYDKASGMAYPQPTAPSADTLTTELYAGQFFIMWLVCNLS